MTIDEASKILHRYLSEGFIMSTQDLHDAMALGIEALRRLKEARFDQRTPYTRQLPGETKE